MSDGFGYDSRRQLYLGDRKENPEAAHDANIRPRPDVAKGVAFGSVSAIEEIFETLALRLVVARSGNPDPCRCDTEGCYGEQGVESNIATEEYWPLLFTPMGTPLLDRD